MVHYQTKPANAVRKVDPVWAKVREEADAIGAYFFYDYARVGCGSIDRASSSLGSWRIRTYLGYGADPGPDLVVSKADGSLTTGSITTVAQPLRMPADQPADY